jgi:hypothetical protein
LQKNGLEGVGILGNHPSIRCNIHVTCAEQQAIAQALIMLSRSTNYKKCQEFMEDGVKLLPLELRLNGKASWDSTLVHIQHSTESASAASRTWEVEAPDIPIHTAPTYFKCPSCTHVESSDCSNFQTTDLDIKQKCNACEKASPVAKWKCVCDKHWHTCATHRAWCMPNARHIRKSKRKKPSANSSNSDHKAKRGRTLEPMTYEQLLSEDLQRAKRKRDASDELGDQPTIILGMARIKTIRVSSLPPSLQRRFKHPGGE